ncbi:putative defense protein 3 isoform X2 [Cheilinus undulatus]|uniref:putative defense protein 3 isoform X2 n=1 Tax=Cheilinus undulatus TaxID=241271 RepID=UPI001BD3241A|nr:putative defense protein 3 isoform X2 [Cheilinus undulatus]
MTVRGPDYRGVLLEARMFGSTNALGSWQLPPPDTKFLQCAGNPAGAVTHSNTNPKGNTTVYSWIPPNSAGPIYFVATVAQQRAVYWIGVRSMTLMRGKPERVNLSITDASTRMAEENPLLVHISCFLMFHLLALK